jgi:hypothetical protein
MQQQLVLAWLKIAALKDSLQSAADIEHEPSRAAKLQHVQDQLKSALKHVSAPPLDVLLGCCEQLVFKIKVRKVDEDGAGGCGLHCCRAEKVCCLGALLTVDVQTSSITRMCPEHHDSTSFVCKITSTCSRSGQERCKEVRLTSLGRHNHLPGCTAVALFSVNPQLVMLCSSACRSLRRLQRPAAEC